MLNLSGRIKNMVWTVGSDHDLAVDIKGSNSYTDTKKVTISSPEVLVKSGFSEKEAEDICTFTAAHEGAHVRLSDTESLIKYFQTVEKLGYDPDAANALMQITEDYRVDYTVTKDRPGYADLRKTAAEAISRQFLNGVSEDSIFNFTKAVSSLVHGEDWSDHKDWGKAVNWDKARAVANDVTSAVESGQLKSSADVAQFALDMYKKYFLKIEEKKKSRGNKKSADADSNSSDNPGGSGGYDENSGGDSTCGGGSDEPKENVAVDDECKSTSKESAEELAKEMLNKSLLDILADGKDKEKLKSNIKGVETKLADTDGLEKRLEEAVKKTERSNGKSLWSVEQRHAFERNFCVGVHAGTRVLLCKAPRGYNYNSNKTKYGLNINHNKGEIRKLTERLREDMRTALTNDGYVSNTGRLIPNKIWRSETLNDNKVFTKAVYNEVGGYVVDILLDASGSQASRTSQIAAQAFIMAEVFSNLNIPCRVTQFDNRDNVTIIKRFRDYEDTQDTNDSCFDYTPGVDNRDGLALLGVYEDLSKRKEEKKILIMLSDGCPQDTMSGCSGAMEEAGGLIYYTEGKKEHVQSLGEAIAAVDDVAKIVRWIRGKGIAVFGIYVGGIERTLQQERYMYGSDFAHIKNMSNFSDVVGRYLHKHIINLD